jgi:hypothetical protein
MALGGRICGHIQDKEGWTDDVFHSVDWTSFSSAVANTKESRTFIIKLINDYLPVGKRVRLYKPYYEAHCPHPATPLKKIAHMFSTVRQMIASSGAPNFSRS